MAGLDVGMIRNIALVGHGGSGKTSLAEALLHKAGATNRLGSVQDGSSMLDASEEEKDRKCSLDSALCHLSHKGHHVNIVATPGELAFCGPAIAALAAVECAVVVISAPSGIQVNTRKMFERARQYGLGVWIVINHIDAPNVDLEGLLGQIREQFGQACVPINLPTGGGKAVVDCFTQESGDADFSSVADAHTAIVEAAVGADDALMEKYLGGELTAEETRSIVPRAVASGDLIPVLFTNCRGDVGIAEFLDALAVFCPSPAAGKQRVLVEDGKETPITCDPTSPVLAQVFKVRSDAKTHIKYTSLRMLSGTITSDLIIKTKEQPKGVRPGQVLRAQGMETHEMQTASAGDIVTFAKLDLKIGDTVYVESPGEVAMPAFPTPMFSLAIEPKSRGDEEKIGAALRRFAEEDPCFISERSEAAELVIRGMGETQLRTYLQRMAKQSKIEVETRPPRIPYRETITTRAMNIEYTHKKQTGGAGQYGKVVINVLPAARGEGYEFVDKIFGGAIDQAFRPSVDKGIQAQLKEGVIAGFPVVDVKVELIDGKTHPVDSKDIAFQIAGRGAFKEGFMKAKPVLLEPIVQIEVTTPADKVGDVQGDLASRRGRPQGQDMLPGNMAIIRATIPLAEVADYSSRLSSITGGQGSYSIEFSHYDPVPGNVQQQIIEAHKKEVEAAHS